jgi:hypothetical protein
MSPPPAASDTLFPPFDRAVLVVVGDDHYLVSAGYQDGLELDAP